MIYKKPKRGKRIFINEEIRTEKMRVVDEEGKQLGIMNKYEAVNLAKEKNLDLVLITEKTTPPICKIIDHGKYNLTV